MYLGIAYRILFQDTYNTLESGQLFKNQTTLAKELLDSPVSVYYLPNRTSDEEEEVYRKELQRLKSYLSQLFTPNTRRFLTKEITTSIGALIREKLPANLYDTEDIIKLVVSDLKANNLGYQRGTAKHLRDINRPYPEDYTTYQDHVELWIKTVIFDTGPTEDPYKMGQANGIRQGALLILGLIGKM